MSSKSCILNQKAGATNFRGSLPPEVNPVYSRVVYENRLKSPGARLRSGCPGMALIALLLAAVCLVPGCSPAPRAVLTKDNLAGKRIAVMMGYSSDHIMSRPEFGAQVFRYDSYGDMMMALRFDRVDAIAMEYDEASVLCRTEPAYTISFVVVESSPYAYPVDRKDTGLMESFNTFLRWFRESPEYADILSRRAAAATAPYVHKAVETPQTAERSLKVALYPGWEPISYTNMESGKWEGSDVELIQHFAKSIGVRVEFVDTGDWLQMVLNLMTDKVDMFLCPDSLVLKKDLEMSGMVTMSEWAFKKDIVLITVREGT